jgi:hypothetical protein
MVSFLLKLAGKDVVDTRHDLRCRQRSQRDTRLR